MLDHVGRMLDRVNVPGLDPGVAALVQVEDLPVAKGDLGLALLGADDVQALVLRTLDDVGRALERRLLDERVVDRPAARRADDLGAGRFLGGRSLHGRRPRLARPLAHQGHLGHDQGVARVDPMGVGNVLVLLPDLRPEVGVVEEPLGDAPKRIAADDDVIGRAVRNGGRVAVLGPVGGDRRRARAQPCGRRRGSRILGHGRPEDEQERGHAATKGSHSLRSHCLPPGRADYRRQATEHRGLRLRAACPGRSDARPEFCGMLAGKETPSQDFFAEF